MIDIIEKHLQDLAADNWDAYKAAFASNVTYVEMSTGVRANGPDEYVKTVQRWKRAFPDLHATILDAVASGNKLVVELRWDGTHEGPLEGPFGAIPPTNKAGFINASMNVRIENGKIVEVHHYFDMLSLLSQLGIAPMPSAQAPQPTARV